MVKKSCAPWRSGPAIGPDFPGDYFTLGRDLAEFGLGVGRDQETEAA